MIHLIKTLDLINDHTNTLTISNGNPDRQSSLLKITRLWCFQIDHSHANLIESRHSFTCFSWDVKQINYTT